MSIHQAEARPLLTSAAISSASQAKFSARVSATDNYDRHIDELNDGDHNRDSWAETEVHRSEIASCAHPQEIVGKKSFSLLAALGLGFR